MTRRPRSAAATLPRGESQAVWLAAAALAALAAAAGPVALALAAVVLR